MDSDPSVSAFIWLLLQRIWIGSAHPEAQKSFLEVQFNLEFVLSAVNCLVLLLKDLNPCID
jgi:hypothetical protein